MDDKKLSEIRRRIEKNRCDSFDQILQARDRMFQFLDLAEQAGMQPFLKDYIVEPNFKCHVEFRSPGNSTYLKLVIDLAKAPTAQLIAKLPSNATEFPVQNDDDLATFYFMKFWVAQCAEWDQHLARPAT